jgi:hypothetical protein
MSNLNTFKNIQKYVYIWRQMCIIRYERKILKGGGFIMCINKESKDVAVNAAGNVLNDGAIGDGQPEVIVNDVHYTAQFTPVSRCICKKDFESWMGYIRRRLTGMCFRQEKANHITGGLVCLTFKATKGSSPYLDIQQIGDSQTIERTFMYAVAIARGEPLQGYTEEEIERTSKQVYGDNVEERRLFTDEEGKVIA